LPVLRIEKSLGVPDWREREASKPPDGPQERNGRRSNTDSCGIPLRKEADSISRLLTAPPRVIISRRSAELRDGRRPLRRSAGDLVDAMKRHLAEFPAEDEGLIFRGPLGAPLRRNNFHRSVRWSRSVVQAGLPAGLHFHDLRHTGTNLAAATGAGTRELMQRMGHGTMRAALIYQHATGERDREIADTLQFRIERELKEMGPTEGQWARSRQIFLWAWHQRKREMTKDFLGAGDENRTRMTSLEDAPSGRAARRFPLRTREVVTVSRRE
jgi:hypothetical protein